MSAVLASVPAVVPAAGGPGGSGAFCGPSRSWAGLRAAGRFSDERYRPETAPGATNARRHAHGVINGQGVAQWTLSGKRGDMATAEECRTALQALAGRLTEVED